MHIRSALLFFFCPQTAHTDSISLLILPATRAWWSSLAALLPRLRSCVLYAGTSSLFSASSERDLQNTQTAPLAAVCTPTIKLVHRTTKDEKTSGSEKLYCLERLSQTLCVCKKLSLESHSDSSLCLPLCCA